MREALTKGANALEPDITLGWLPVGPAFLPCSLTDPLDNLVDWDSSFPNRSGRCADTKFVDWLKGVHGLAKEYPQLALVVFDVKSSAATAQNGPVIVNAINHLNTDGVELNVILSVATRKDGALFDNLIGPNAQLQLGLREGVQINGEDDAGVIVKYFDRGYDGNIRFGDGTAGPWTTPAHGDGRGGGDTSRHWLSKGGDLCLHD